MCTLSTNRNGETRTEGKTMTYQMSREEKNGIVGLALKASMAFKAYNDALSAKGPKDVDQMTKLMQNRDTTFATLTAAVSALDLSKMRELCKQFQYRLDHDPLAAEAKGKIGWDLSKAQTLVNAMRSLQSALEHDGGQHKDSQDRVHVVKNRADTLNLYVTACQESGVVPENGMTPGTIRFVLRQLDKQREELVKAGNNEQAIRKAKLYRNVEQNFSWLLKQDDRPQFKPQPQPQQQLTLGQVLPEGTAQTLSAHVAPAKPQPRPGSRPSRKGGKQRP